MSKVFDGMRGISMAFAGMVVLAGCGGGGGGDGGTGVSPPPPPAPPPPPVRSSQPVVFKAVEPNSGDQHLFSQQDDGGSLTQLTPAFPHADGFVNWFSRSPDKSTIAYAANGEAADRYDLYLVPANGGAATRITTLPARSTIDQIAWAPDSSQVAYVANPQGTAPRGFRHNEVFLVNRDGSNNRKISGGVGTPPVVAVQNIKWSPDSRYLAQAVLSLDPFTTIVGINTFDASLGSPNSTRVTPPLDWQNGERLDDDFAWSPDSSRLAFRSSHEQAGRLMLYSVLPDGSDIQRANGPLVAGGNVQSFSWSPDSSTIAYMANQAVDNRVDFYASNIDGTNNRQISRNGTRGTVLNFLASWSADGSQLLYSLDQDVADQAEIWLGNIDGSGSMKLNPALPADANAANPVFSPDGSRVAYVSNMNAVPEIFVVNTDGSNNVNVSAIAAAGADARSPRWSPDGNLIAYTATTGAQRQIELYVSSADGNSGNRINEDLGTDEDITAADIRWSDDSTRVVFQDKFRNLTDEDILDLWVGTTDGSAPLMLNGTNDFVGGYAY